MVVFLIMFESLKNDRPIYGVKQNAKSWSRIYFSLYLHSFQNKQRPPKQKTSFGYKK
jgi:hypothetical protein